MGLIIQAAKLVLCQGCGRHGYIVFGDGSKTDEFASRSVALEEVSNALLAKKIVEPEAEYLRKEVHESYLLSSEEEEMIGALKQVIETFHQGPDPSLEGKTEEGKENKKEKRTLH